MSKIYTINNEKGTSISELFQSSPFNDMEQKGWTIQSYSAAGIDYVLLHATEEANVFPLHKDPNEWFGYVVMGSGELHLGNEHETTETLNYQSGDIIIFKPHTYHGWKSTSLESKLMFIKPSQ